MLVAYDCINEPNSGLPTLIHHISSRTLHYEDREAPLTTRTERHRTHTIDSFFLEKRRAKLLGKLLKLHIFLLFLIFQLIKQILKEELLAQYWNLGQVTTRQADLGAKVNGV